jgi:hypothetical protein
MVNTGPQWISGATAVLVNPVQNGGIVAHLFVQGKHLFVQGIDANNRSC